MMMISLLIYLISSDLNDFTVHSQYLLDILCVKPGEIYSVSRETVIFPRFIDYLY